MSKPARKPRAGGRGYVRSDAPKRPNPLTSDREYSDAEREFVVAMDAYKRRFRVQFPAHSDYLRVLLSLGYAKGTAPPERGSG